ncbi:MAG: sigma 54-interacting transcriptional regulator [Deltaproteobacteria bacterium]|nr:sigma 54-interacting transcriptional regulator [Deltaproteobacteria bacterium]
MGSPDKVDLETPFRLRGEVEGRERVFDLPVGEIRVGSSPGSDLRLSAHGVSRQHALLVIQQGGLVIEDRGSRNGTFVDGQRVRRAAALEGAELRFGPVALTLQSLRSDDATVAISLGNLPSANREPTKMSSLWSEVTALETSHNFRDSAAASSLRLLDEMGSALALGDASNALRCLGESLGFQGCCLVEVSGQKPPLVLHSWGLLPSHPPQEAFLEPEDRKILGPTWVRSGMTDETPGIQYQVAMQPSRQDQRLALVLWGNGEENDERRILLRILIRMFEAFAPRDSDGQQVSPPEAKQPQSLNLPEGFLAGSSPPLLALFRQLERVAPEDVSVLLTGSTGVGKGVFASVIHRSSPRRNQPLISVNCAALPDELLEAELFGITKGTATGVTARVGHFAAAEGGSLFLDEIGELPLNLQAKLLRALQEKEIQPLGGHPQAIDVRILAATNADLRQAIRDGHFRQDLYFRLTGYILEIPPLRACREDLPLFAEHFLRRFARKRGVFPRGLSLAALRGLLAYDWPGNIRELEHEIQRLVLRADPGQVIDSGLLSAEIRESNENRQVESTGERKEAAPTASLLLRERLEAVEKSTIREALKAADGIQIRAAELLGISRNGLARRMKRLGLS